MKKTQSISIASTLFWIEEDAYQVLEHYLSSIKAHFAPKGEESEVVRDIEARVAEQFLESKKKIVTLDEVHAVIASMGDVGDFGDEKIDSKDAADEEPRAGKRLYRNSDDKVIAGVASGIAAYLGIDVLWVRMAFVLFTFVSGFGVLLYLTLCIFIPEAKTASQLLEMKGAPVTLETLSGRAKDRWDELKNDRHHRGFLRRILTTPFTIIGRVLQFIFTKIVPIFGRLFGAVIALGATLALLALTVLLGLMLTHLGGTYLSEFPIGDILSPGMVALVSLVVYLAVGIPFYFLLFLGTSLLARRRVVSSTISFTLLGVWFLSIVAAGVIGISVAERVSSYMKTSPAYQETERTVTVSEPLTGIIARNGVNLEYIQDSKATTTTITLEGRVKDMDHLVPSVQDGVLTLAPEKQTRDTKFCIFCNLYSVPKVLVTAPNVTAFTGENGTRISADKITSASKVTISLSKGASGTFSVDAKEVAVAIKNAVHLDLSGKTTRATISAENGTYIDALKFLTTHAILNIQNSSRVDIGDTETLDVKARNGATVRYMETTTLTQDTKNGARVVPYDESE